MGEGGRQGFGREVNDANFFCGFGSGRAVGAIINAFEEFHQYND